MISLNTPPLPASSWGHDPTTPHPVSPVQSPALQSLPSSEGLCSPLDTVEKDITMMDPDFQTPVDDAKAAHDNLEVQQATKDLEYYMETVVFKIEDSLFRIPAYLFKSETDFFNSLFEQDIYENERMIQRDDVTKTDFRALLKLLYPKTFTMVHTLSGDEWISVLKVSTRWMMLEIRRTAIEHLSAAPLDLVDRIVLAREYSVLPWLKSAYTTLIYPTSDLSGYDSVAMERIGLPSILKLHRAREQALPQRAEITVMRQRINEEFEAELAKSIDMNPLEQAGLSQEYNVSEWRRRAFIELVSREQLLSVEEARTLGLETAIRLCGARELRKSLGAESAVLQELQWDYACLTEFSVVDRLVMARGYGVRAWVRDALYDLAQRPAAPSTSEAVQIGLDTAISVCKARQRHDPGQASSESGPFDIPSQASSESDLVDTCSQASLASDAVFQAALEREFGAELSKLEALGKQLVSKSEIEAQEKRRLQEELEEQRMNERRKLEAERAAEEMRLEEQRMAEQRERVAERAAKSGPIKKKKK